MKKSSFIDEPIRTALRQMEIGESVIVDLCQKRSIAKTTFYAVKDKPPLIYPLVNDSTSSWGMFKSRGWVSFLRSCKDKNSGFSRLNLIDYFTQQT